MKRLRPMFSYYGSKFNLSPKYNVPSEDTIIEPFAGSACFSLLYPTKNVLLFDADPIICGVWSYLISAKESEILALPNIGLNESVNDYRLSQEQRWLIGFWLNMASTSPRQKRSTWKNATTKGQNIWGTKIKDRIASQLRHIRHWKVENTSYENIPNRNAYWFIDPPYMVRGNSYRFSSKLINYKHLSDWCLSRGGTVTVCEQNGSNWLPFEPFSIVNGQKRVTSEVVFHRPAQLLEAEQVPLFCF